MKREASIPTARLENDTQLMCPEADQSLPNSYPLEGRAYFDILSLLLYSWTREQLVMILHIFTYIIDRVETEKNELLETYSGEHISTGSRTLLNAIHFSDEAVSLFSTTQLLSTLLCLLGLDIRIQRFVYGDHKFHAKLHSHPPTSNQLSVFRSSLRPAVLDYLSGKFDNPLLFILAVRDIHKSYTHSILQTKAIHLHTRLILE